MKVALVHDDLMQYGGAERVLDGLCEIFPDAPIYTSVFNDQNKQLKNKFGSKKIVTSFLQKIPGWRSFYKGLLPLYPIAFEQFDFSEFDLVISHTTRFAKAIITKPTTKHICYCHTPPRFLWNFSEGIRGGIKEVLFTKLRIYDVISAKRVDKFIAGSKNASRRIAKIYREESEVVYPFIDLDRFKNVQGFNGGYFVVLARLNDYKRIDLAIDACGQLKLPLKVIGMGPQLSNLKRRAANYANIEFLGNIDDKGVVLILSGARALIIPGEEDFGLTSLEAQALGKPVIAYNRGGARETVIEKKTGLFFDSQTVDNLKALLERFNPSLFDIKDCQENANKFSRSHFIKCFRQVIGY